MNSQSLFQPHFFVGNRQKLYEQLEHSSLLVLTAHTAMQQSLDQPYPFLQEPNFWYLTGLDVADWMLIVDVDARREWLVAPQVAEVHQIFDGSLAAADARALGGVDQVVSKRDAGKLLRELAGRKGRICTLLPDKHLPFYAFYPNPAQRMLVRRLKALGATIEDIRPQVTKLRAIKQPVEINAIQRAVDITVDGMKAVVQALPDLEGEYEAEAVLTSTFRRHQARHGFEPIIAAGKNATTLHYEANGDRFSKGDWLLMDVSARFAHHNADITRSVPIGTPTDHQLERYEALRQAQKRIISFVQPGVETKQYMQQAEQVMHDTFVSLGLVGKLSDIKAIYEIMPHAISHGLGYDTHDPLGGPSELQPGMVLTVEVGMYLSDEGFGIRLEDDIVIEPHGSRNMSSALPTSLDELLP